MQRCSIKKHISIHSPHARGDVSSITSTLSSSDFNPLPSCEGRRRSGAGGLRRADFNPLPSCEGRRLLCLHRVKLLHISIHSPHARGDPRPCSCAQCPARHFNPLPSCEGRRLAAAMPTATPYNFNPLPSCEGRQRHSALVAALEVISIHSPHARGDDLLMVTVPASKSFQSTPLMRGETFFMLGQRDDK